MEDDSDQRTCEVDSLRYRDSETAGTGYAKSRAQEQRDDVLVV